MSMEFSDPGAGGQGFTAAGEGMRHSCGPDLYQGRAELVSKDSFHQFWTVNGPRKQGSIFSVFRRTKGDVIMRDGEGGDQVAEGLGATRREDEHPYCCYLLSSVDGAKSYCGITTDLTRRLLQHNGLLTGGAAATRPGRPWTVAAAVVGLSGRSAAQSLEVLLKKNRQIRGVNERKTELRKLASDFNRRCLDLPDTVTPQTWKATERKGRR